VTSFCAIDKFSVNIMRLNFFWTTNLFKYLLLINQRMLWVGREMFWIIKGNLIKLILYFWVKYSNISSETCILWLKSHYEENCEGDYHKWEKYEGQVYKKIGIKKIAQLQLIKVECVIQSITLFQRSKYKREFGDNLENRVIPIEKLRFTRTIKNRRSFH
jgi:hypothetical protein